jgi:hypothetical protein
MLVGITGNAGLAAARGLPIKASDAIAINEFREISTGDLLQIMAGLQRHKQRHFVFPANQWMENRHATVLRPFTIETTPSAWLSIHDFLDARTIISEACKMG